MPVLNMKPHTLSYLQQTEGYNDENGDYIKGTSEWLECEKCDAVPNGKADVVVFDDGKSATYSYTVYLSASCREFKQGDKVKIDFLGGTSTEFDVLGFHRYQHQSKLWV